MPRLSPADRAERLARWADIASCVALAAELADDAKTAARWQLEAMWLEARRSRIR